MDLSYALAGTLVRWNTNKQITAGLASRWEITNPKTYKFTLPEGAKWSNGSPITAQEVKRSSERSLRTYPEDLRSLANILDHIETPSERVFEFHLKITAADSNLLGKLTEPNFGVLMTKDGGAISLAVSSGPFYLDSATNDELVLKKNLHWNMVSSEMADRVVIRRTPSGAESQSVLLNDPWPNLIETSSLIPGDILQKYEGNRYQVWKRPIDKVFLIELGKSVRNEEGFKLLRSLGDNLDRQLLTAGLSGFRPTQVFPHGYQLYNPSLQCHRTPAQKSKDKVSRKLNVLIAQSRLSAQLQENLRKALLGATGADPNFIILPLQEAFKRRRTGDFDIYVGTYGLADPDPEGIMSFYFEGDSPVIASGTDNSVAKLDSARKEPDERKRLTLMQAIVGDALCKGHVLPLFHLSTVGIGREELDFGSIPTSEESVTLSKIRFK